jgi:hypothetical protein
MKAYLKFKDVGGIQSMAWFKDVVNSVAIGTVATFAALVKARSNAGLIEYGLIRSTGFDLSVGGIAGPESNVKNKARLHFNWINANGETKNLALWIPAPDMAMFENVDGVGYRVLKSSGEAIRDALRTMTGIPDLAFSVGVLDYSESKPGTRSENSIEFTDVVENKCWMAVPQPVSMAAMQTFGSFIDGYSIAPIGRGVYSEPENVVLLSTNPTAIPNTDINGLDSVERRCTCKFMYIEGTRRKFMTMNLPAPKSANLVQGKDKPGYALDIATGNGLAIDITALYGAGNRAVTFKHGSVAQSELDNQ